MTHEEMAAVLIMSLEEDVAANVIRNFGEDELTLIGKHMKTLIRISKDDIELAAKEFCLLAGEKGKRNISVQDGTFENIMTKALGKDRGIEFVKMSKKEGATFDSPIIRKLKNTDIKTLTESVRMEHPQTAALILAHLRPEQSAGILGSFPMDKQEDIAKRIATLESVPLEFMEDLAKSLEAEVITGKDSVEQIGGVKMVAEILNRMSQSSENKILKAFEKSDQDLAIEIRAVMFIFEDIVKLDDSSMRILLSEVNRKDLPRAFKIADNELKEKVYKGLSARGAAMLKEDLADMPPIRLSEVERSQKAILDVAKRLEAEEKIVLSTAKEEDIYV